MRKLYEIDADIESCIANGTDPETGEFLMTDLLDALQLERETKLEGVALFVKDTRAEATMIHDEIENLTKRMKRLTRNADGAEEWLSYQLDGNKFSTPRVECVFRKSEVADVDPEFIEWAYKQKDDMSKYITHTESDKPNKQEIRKFLKAGGSLEHCRLVEKRNMTIK